MTSRRPSRVIARPCAWTHRAWAKKQCHGRASLSVNPQLMMLNVGPDSDGLVSNGNPEPESQSP